MASKSARVISLLSLFSSAGTLVCCALPALLITLGMGLTLASLTSTAPWLFALSRYKAYLFIAAGFLLLASFYFIHWRPRRFAACGPGEACEVAGKYSRFVFWLSVSLYLIGVTTAYIYLPVVMYFAP
jgi:mercuric ion transport protein